MDLVEWRQWTIYNVRPAKGRPTTQYKQIRTRTTAPVLTAFHTHAATAYRVTCLALLLRRRRIVTDAEAGHVRQYLM
jgi:hypothetical protein